MANAKQTGCRAQRIEASGLNLGILDLENRIAYVPDSDAFMELVKPSGIWKAGDITAAYINLTETLREQGFSINYYKPKSVKESRRVYDILS